MSDLADAVIEPMPPALSPGGEAGRSKGMWRSAMRQTLRKPSAVIGLVLLSCSC